MPICPHCQKDIDPDSVKLYKIRPFISARANLYTCPHCDVILGVHI